jgi:hypothetical protein
VSTPPAACTVWRTAGILKSWPYFSNLSIVAGKACKKSGQSGISVSNSKSSYTVRQTAITATACSTIFELYKYNRVENGPVSISPARSRKKNSSGAAHCLSYLI